MTERMNGLLLGEVANLDDPDKLGRIKAKLITRKGKPMSQWAPIARPLASNGFGLFWQPQENDIVLLGFEEGVLERPYVVGSIYSGDNQPPVTETLQRMIRSETGHEILLDDTQNSEAITIKDKSGSTIVMDAAGITIESSKDITLKGENVNIEAGAQLTAKGNPIHLNP